jgi:hypothetical protein
MKQSRFTDQQIALALQQATRFLCARLMANGDGLSNLKKLENFYCEE